jgi:glycosyltransferase involved in cell wall biosynthesis
MKSGVDERPSSLASGVMTDRTEFEAAKIHERDPHDSVDVEAVLSELTVVIPTNREDNFTLESLPEAVEVVVATEPGLNVARNRGIERADTEWIALVDDDVTFPTQLTAWLLDGMHRRHLVGLEDYWPMENVLGRFMLFHRSLWATVDGFDESRPHGGDTDFCLRARKAGASVVRLPRHLIPHHDAASDLDTGAHAEWLWYLLRRHPIRVAPKAVKLVARKIGVVSPRRADYPDGWRSTVWMPPAVAEGADEVDADGTATGCE